MSGIIGLTIREPEGKQHRMCMGTIDLPNFVQNIRFLNRDSSHLNKYLQAWYSMKRDYDKHKKDGQFELPGTKEYATHPFLAPINYGLLVVDMSTNTILDHTSDFQVDLMHSASISNDLYDERKGFEKKTDELASVRFRELFNAGKIKGTKGITKDFKGSDLTQKTLDEALDDIQKGSFYVQLDMSPYEIKVYRAADVQPDRIIQDATQMMKDLDGLGFKLNMKEKSVWNEWMNSRKE